MLAVTIFLNGRSLPFASCNEYSVAFCGTAPRTAYSTLRTAGLAGEGKTKEKSEIKDKSQFRDRQRASPIRRASHD